MQTQRESPEAGAVREAVEELGIRPADLSIGSRWVDDHGGWSYTTVLARPIDAIDPTHFRLNSESTTAPRVPLTWL